MICLDVRLHGKGQWIATRAPKVTEEHLADVPFGTGKTQLEAIRDLCASLQDEIDEDSR